MFKDASNTSANGVGIIGNSATVDLGRVRFTSDFECGSGRDFCETAPDHYAFSIPADPGPVHGDYEWYFCIQTHNSGEDSVELQLEARRSQAFEQCNEWVPSHAPVFVSDDFESWHPLQGVLINNAYEYLITLTLAPRQSLFVSNSVPHRYGAMCDWLQRKASDHHLSCGLTTVGSSVQGRDILLLTITDRAVPDSLKDRILITSGLHPAEPDWLATTAIIDYLLSDDVSAKRALETYVFDIVPQCNPDGCVMGTNGCNAKGVNLYWDFRPGQRDMTPETACIWDWMGIKPPAIYLDFHCYVHAHKKDYQPYLKPVKIYRSRVIREIVSIIDCRLTALCQGRAVRGDLTTWPSTLSHYVTREYDTIAYTKFHLHLKHGAQKSGDLAVAVMKQMLDAAEAHRPIRLHQRRRTWWQGACETGFVCVSAFRTNRAWRTAVALAQRVGRRVGVSKRIGSKAAAHNSLSDGGGLCSLWPWYEDVCAYFGITQEEATRRATQGRSREIWVDKDNIEISEERVIEAWQSDTDMVVRNCWYRELKARTDWRQMLVLAGFEPGDSVLDFGCGGSSLTKWFLFHASFDSGIGSTRISLADLEGPMLDFCRWRYGDAVKYIPVQAGTGWQALLDDYDVIFCLDVLEHLWSPLRCVEALCLHLKPGGRLLETFIDDTKSSNLKRANSERPSVMAFLSRNMRLVLGSTSESSGLRVWEKHGT